jgi:hypothetical protein
MENTDEQKKCLSEAQIGELARESAVLRQISLLCLDYLEEEESLVAGIARLLATLRRYQEEAAWDVYEEILKNEEKTK